MGFGTPAPLVSLTLRGRGAAIDPPNRFEPVVLDPADSQTLDSQTFEELSIDGDPDPPSDPPDPSGGLGNRPAVPTRYDVPTRYYVEHCRTALTYNDSPDIPFEVSLNPYRGCEHGCSYCYARPFHEYLGFSAGLEFETIIFCKTGLPELLRAELAKPRYRPATLALSGITDAYQPVERRLRITRRCLEILESTGHPVDVITKSHLVTRDLDLLSSLARRNAARVDITITTLDAEVARKMEPRAAHPQRRLEAIRACAEAGVPVGVLCSPIVPGLTDHELPAIMTAAREAGAGWAHLIPLRLPGAVERVFVDWLEREFPLRADKVLGRQREMRGGKLNDARFGHRFRGQGPYYEHLKGLLDLHRRRLGMEGHGPKLSTAAFAAPRPDRHAKRGSGDLATGQMTLF